MTSEHVTITEEVVKDGVLVTQERIALQTTVETPEQIASRQAMSVNHPDFVPADQRVYTYNEATGMSESAPRVDAVAEAPAGPHVLTVAELRAYAAEHDINLEGATVKADIKAHILDPMSINQLREFADLEGTDLGDATRKADVYALVLAGPQAEAEEVEAEPVSEEEPESTETPTEEPTGEQTGSFKLTFDPNPFDHVEGEHENLPDESAP